MPLTDLFSGASPGTLWSLLLLTILIGRIWLGQINIKREQVAAKAALIKAKAEADKRESEATAAEKVREAERQKIEMERAAAAQERLERQLEKAQAKLEDEMRQAMHNLKNKMHGYEMELAVYKAREEGYGNERKQMHAHLETIRRIMESRERTIEELRQDNDGLRRRLSEVVRRLHLDEPVTAGITTNVEG